MRIAVVTGSSKGIGRAVVKALLILGYRVYGISRTVGEEEFLPEYIHLACDLLDTRALTHLVDDLIARESSIDLLVNNAGIGCFGPHEELPVDVLQRMIRLNLEVPVILSRLLLRSLKASGGQIINISSVTAGKEAPHGCAYAATKAGLTHFSESLFAEVRKSGVKVTVIEPDMTRSDFFEPLNFTCAEGEEYALLPQDVADAVAYAVSAPGYANVSRVTLQPQKNRIARKDPRGSAI